MFPEKQDSSDTGQGDALIFRRLEICSRPWLESEKWVERDGMLVGFPCLQLEEQIYPNPECPSTRIRSFADACTAVLS